MWRKSRKILFVRGVKSILLGEAEKPHLMRARSDEEAEIIDGKVARQQVAMRWIRQYELMRLVGGRQELLCMPAHEVEALWLVHQARMMAEHEANERAMKQ